MEKLTVILPLAEVDTALSRLMHLGVVSLSREEQEELTSLHLEADAAAKAAALAARVDAVLPLLTKRSRRKKRLFAAPLPFDPAEFVQTDVLLQYKINCVQCKYQNNLLWLIILVFYQQEHIDLH